MKETIYYRKITAQNPYKMDEGSHRVYKMWQRIELVNNKPGAWMKTGPVFETLKELKEYYQFADRQVRFESA